MTETHNSLPYVEHGSLKYTDPNRVKKIQVMVDCPPNPYSSGYGRKIPTRYGIVYLGKGMTKRFHRVYVMNYANAGSAYILIDREVVFLDSDTEHDIEEARDNVLAR